jgi:hypothetical protein
MPARNGGGTGPAAPRPQPGQNTASSPAPQRPGSTAGSPASQRPGGSAGQRPARTPEPVAPKSPLRAPADVIGKTDGGPGKWVKAEVRAKGADYQEQISGVGRGAEYDMNGVLFDGYDPSRAALLDAKDWVNYPPLNTSFWHANALQEARSQVIAANGTAIEYHFSTQAAADAVNGLFKANGIAGIRIVVTPSIH